MRFFAFQAYTGTNGRKQPQPLRQVDVDHERPGIGQRPLQPDLKLGYRRGLLVLAQRSEAKPERAQNVRHQLAQCILSGRWIRGRPSVVPKSRFVHRAIIARTESRLAGSRHETVGATSCAIDAWTT